MARKPLHRSYPLPGLIMPTQNRPYSRSRTRNPLLFLAEPVTLLGWSLPVTQLRRVSTIVAIAIPVYETELATKPPKLHSLRIPAMRATIPIEVGHLSVNDTTPME